MLEVLEIKHTDLFVLDQAARNPGLAYLQDQGIEQIDIWNEDLN